MSQLTEIVKIAEIHANRIHKAMEHLNALFPMDVVTFNGLQEEQILWIELLIHRFGKLQDLLGAKIIDLFLKENEETTDNLTMLDKLHKLERLGILNDAKRWQEMRAARNHAVHEYPDHPDLTVGYLNTIVGFVPELLTIFNNLKQKILR